MTGVATLWNCEGLDAVCPAMRTQCPSISGFPGWISPFSPPSPAVPFSFWSITVPSNGPAECMNPTAGVWGDFSLPRHGGGRKDALRLGDWTECLGEQTHSLAVRHTAADCRAIFWRLALFDSRGPRRAALDPAHQASQFRAGLDRGFSSSI
jgi:hypothetical protein